MPADWACYWHIRVAVDYFTRYRHYASASDGLFVFYVIDSQTKTSTVDKYGYCSGSLYCDLYYEGEGGTVGQMIIVSICVGFYSKGKQDSQSK